VFIVITFFTTSIVTCFAIIFLGDFRRQNVIHCNSILGLQKNRLNISAIPRKNYNHKWIFLEIGFLPLWSQPLFYRFFHSLFHISKFNTKTLCVFSKSQLKYEKKVKSEFTYMYRIQCTIFSLYTSLHM